MIRLPESFDGRADQRGYRFTIVERIGCLALLSKIKPEHSEPGYEVVFVKQLAERAIFGQKPTPAHETLPSPSEWGIAGWTYSTLEEAQEKFRKLQKPDNLKEEMATCQM